MRATACVSVRFRWCQIHSYQRKTINSYKWNVLTFEPCLDLVDLSVESIFSEMCTSWNALQSNSIIFKYSYSNIRNSIEESVLLVSHPTNINFIYQFFIIKFIFEFISHYTKLFYTINIPFCGHPQSLSVYTSYVYQLSTNNLLYARCIHLSNWSSNPSRP